MNLKNSLSEDELNSLIELLYKRRDELEGRITIDSVKESLKELGLLHLFSENDIKEVRKQVSREFARKQRKIQLTQAIILIIIIAPLSAFGGCNYWTIDKSNINLAALSDRLTMTVYKLYITIGQ
ncbi:MAG: hypothetical protein F6K39_07645 [Okeania sp. SIO3B3]|nr:hypothetical protein [Okeania sp. SIO3B3]